MKKKQIVVREDQLTDHTRRAIVSLGDMQTMAKSIAESGMFGVKTEAQAMALMLLCQAEGIHPVMALRRYHIIDNKPAYRADALQGEFEQEGAILWHERNEREVSATFFRDKRKVDGESIKRSKQRYDALMAGQPASMFAEIGEVTIIRTMADAIEKHVAQSYKEGKGWVMKWNWQQSPRQMLHARCLTEGVRAINPGLVAGIYTEDEIIDMGPEPTDLDQRPSAEVIERNVKQATANATEAELVIPEQSTERVTDDKPSGAPAVNSFPADSAQDSNDYGPLKITEDNYGELKSHIGDARKGTLLGIKIKDLHSNVIEWLYKKWRDTLTPGASDQDYRLKAAVTIAYGRLIKDDVGSALKAAKPVEKARDVSESPAEDKRATEAARVLIANELIERAEDLILTPDQFCRLLNRQGVLGEGEMLTDLSLAMLKFIQSEAGWKVVKEAAEAEGKPKVTHSRAKKKTVRRKK